MVTKKKLEADLAAANEALEAEKQKAADLESAQKKSHGAACASARVLWTAAGGG